MARLEEADLRRFAEEYRTSLGGSPDEWTHVIALETLASIFGVESDNPVGPLWVFGNVFGYGEGLSDDYLRKDWSGGSTQRRIVRFAEMLYHFQELEGFDRLLGTLRADTIESAFAELEAVKLLFLSDLQFRFIKTSGAKESDFDVEVLTPEGQKINCEMKCKLETTELSDGTIVHTLNAAAKQLPRDEANAIFVKVPEKWVRQPEVEATVDRAVRRFFGQSRRVAAIVFHWQETTILGNGPITVVTKHRRELNENAKFKVLVKAALTDRLYSLAPPVSASNYGNPERSRWRYFDQIAREMASQ